ncbi:MAG: endonuclease III [Holosporales bacterium]|jgi:endonuclease-3|nr:endonuclease III [Holosporales bacterium]
MCNKPFDGGSRASRSHPPHRRQIKLDNVKKIFEQFATQNPNPQSELQSVNDFTFVIAVLLSAQTTDKAVNKATEKLFKIANTPKEIIKLGIDKLKDYIRSIGLCNNKSKNIIALSEILISQCDSKIPNDRNELKKLPGIGRKSANVISNKLFGTAYIAVDTHVLRLSKRLNFSISSNPKIVEEDLLQVIPTEYHKNASDWLILHGRYTCTARNPSCFTCNIRELCHGYGHKIKPLI